MMAERRPRDFNDAAVACMKKKCLQPAWHLFKGALELHLAQEKRRADPTITISQFSQDCMARAETHYQNFLASSERVVDDGDTSESEEISFGESEAFCHLFRIQTPLKLADDLPGSGNSAFIALTIIFNLALIEHLRDPFSGQSLQLYRLAASLLTGEEWETHLELAIVNNIGVHLYEIGNTSLGEQYMRRLALIFESITHTTSPPWLTARMQDGVKFNLHWYANPQYKISPAA